MDETGCDEYFQREYGYSPIGEKIHTQVSGKRYQRQSVMGLRNNQHQLAYSMIYQDTATSHTVLSFFKTYLPQLPQPAVVIMDNASYHKSQQLKDLFQKHNQLLIFLPPYSPDLNPIENLWATIKQYLRSYYDYSLTLYENLCNVVNLYSV